MWRVVFLSCYFGRSLLSLVERVVVGGATIVLLTCSGSLHGGTEQRAQVPSDA
jgi:hypothetical protein